MDEAAEGAKEMAEWPEISIEELQDELEITYVRTPSKGACPADPFIHGPQDRCHPYHPLYTQVESLISKLQEDTTHKLSGDEAQRLALAAFWCARYNKLENVDEIESWPKGAPWSSRLLTLHQHPGKGPEGRRAGAVDIAAMTGLAAKHNQLIMLIRYTDRGLTFDSGNPWQ